MYIESKRIIKAALLCFIIAAVPKTASATETGIPYPYEGAFGKMDILEEEARSLRASSAGSNHTSLSDVLGLNKIDRMGWHKFKSDKFLEKYV